MTNGRLWTDGQHQRLPFPTSTVSDMKGLCAEVHSWRSLEHILTASIQRRVHPKSDCSAVCERLPVLPPSPTLSLTSKCLILLLVQDDGLHYNVQSVEYPFSCLISPSWSFAMKRADVQRICWASLTTCCHVVFYHVHESVSVSIM